MNEAAKALVKANQKNNILDYAEVKQINLRYSSCKYLRDCEPKEAVRAGWEAKGGAEFALRGLARRKPGCRDMLAPEVVL